MRIYLKRKSNGERVYWCSWTEGGVTRRQSTRTSTREAAELVAKRWERERADPAHAAATVATLATEARTFLDECKGHIADPTIGIYERAAGHLLRVIGDVRLADVTVDVVANYFRQRRLEKGAKRGSRVSDGTMGLEWVTLSSILKSARHRNRFHKDPSSLRPLRFSAMARRVERFLTWGELTALIMALPEHRRSTVMFAVSTGARRAEWRRASFADVTVVSGGEWVVHLNGRKTPGADRFIPVPPLFRTLFGSVMKHADPKAPLMFDEWGSHAQDMERACRRAGIAPAGWNDLRRTFASLLIQSGESEDVVARLMGHTSTKMVKTVYGRQTAETLRALLRDPRVNQDEATGVTVATATATTTSRESLFSQVPANGPMNAEESMRRSSTVHSERVRLVFERIQLQWLTRNPPATHRVAIAEIQRASLRYLSASLATGDQ